VKVGQGNNGYKNIQEFLPVNRLPHPPTVPSQRGRCPSDPDSLPRGP
jgi:hypothetical protein